MCTITVDIEKQLETKLLFNALSIKPLMANKSRLQSMAILNYCLPPYGGLYIYLTIDHWFISQM